VQDALADVLGFLVYPSGEQRGVVRLEGSWSLEQKSAAQMKDAP